ncbi:hypothetical protein OAG24_01040 [bacterium]|nr:hypothetical protein [bacterium]
MPTFGGIKKPLNQLEGPVYPDIKKGPPIFKWSRKHWSVGSDVLRDTEHMSQFYEPAVLAQSRDYNKTIYGQSSHKDIVNAAFRPPIQNPLFDHFPMNRIPVTSEAIIPRINPGTAFSDGTGGYHAKNERHSDIEGALTDRISTGEMRPTFYCPIDQPLDNSVLPTLETKIPSVSASAGFKMPYTMDAPAQEVELHSNQIDAPIEPGFTAPFTVDGENGLEHTVLFNNRPDVPVTAGANPQIQINAPIRDDIELETQLTAPIDVGNLGTANEGGGYHERMYDDSSETSVGNFMQDSHPNYSYIVPATTSFRTENERTYKPHFRKKLQPKKHYGKISHASYIPKSGVEQPRYNLKTNMVMAGGPKEAQYHF